MFKVHFFLDTKGGFTTHAQRIIKLGEAENSSMLLLLFFPSANLTYTECHTLRHQAMQTGAY